MTTDNKLTEELKNAYDMMTPSQMDRNLDCIEVEPLSEESKQRIKDLIGKNMDRTDFKTTIKQ